MYGSGAVEWECEKVVANVVGVTVMDVQVGTVSRTNFNGLGSSGCYDGRYWTMWTLPMSWCTDAAQVPREIGVQVIVPVVLGARAELRRQEAGADLRFLDRQAQLSEG